MRSKKRNSNLNIKDTPDSPMSHLGTLLSHNHNLSGKATVRKTRANATQCLPPPHKIPGERLHLVGIFPVELVIGPTHCPHVKRGQVRLRQYRRNSPFIDPVPREGGRRKRREREIGTI